MARQNCNCFRQRFSVFLARVFSPVGPLSTLRRIRRRYAGVLLATLLLAACSTGSGQGQPSNGRVLLWHMWNESDTLVLDQLLARFHEVYPEVTVISIPFSPDELQEQFAITVDRGLGPDLIIAPQLWTPELADLDLIAAVDEERMDLSTFNPSGLNTLRYGERLFGLPLALQTSALYYNRSLVTEPPTTLDAVLEQAAAGNGIAIDTNFDAAFWGVQAFGGRLLDDEDRVVLNQGGFANWMDWLREANNIPNVILDNDAGTLKELFSTGKVAYYIGSSSELSGFRQTLGADGVGVASLPAGPNDAAGPLLTSEAFFFSTASSPAQAERALLLVQFMTNPEQQRRLARETGRIPANAQVRIDRRITPAVASFVEQSKTAVSLRLTSAVFDTIRQGRDTYVQVLEGLTRSAEAALALTESVNQAQGMDTLTLVTEVLCEATGTVTVWHSWPEHQLAALEQIATVYRRLCPGLEVEFQAFLPDELPGHYRQAVRAGDGPDLLLTSSDQVMQLADAELIADISENVSPDFQQRYIPAAPDTVRIENRLFGLPITLDSLALYYNAFLVAEAPVDLGDLLAQISPERLFVIPSTSFDALHWGAAAFGGRIFDAGGSLVLNDDGVEEWLEWLRSAQATSGLTLVPSQAEAADRFVSGEAVFLVGGLELLPDLQLLMGSTGVGVAPLPSGPEGPSGPVLKSQALMLNPQSPNPDVALEFARYVTGMESQQILVESAQVVPANNTLATDGMPPAIGAFVQQAGMAVASPNTPAAGAVMWLGSIIYDKVLQQNATPAVVLDDFTTFVQRAYVAGENGETCDDVGELVLWHSLHGKAVTALDQVITDFALVCPGLFVEALFVDPDDLPNQLAVAVQTAAAASETPPAEPAGDANGEAPALPAPDFFLASHELIEPLSVERLVQPITEFVDGATLIPFLPEALGAFQSGDALYGLPFSVETTAFYYDAQVVDTPPTDLYELFASTTISTPLALDSSFRQAFWGTLSFSGNLNRLQEITTELDATGLKLEQNSLLKWLRWLRSVQSRPGVFLARDPNRLKELFVTGNATYLIASTDLLAPLRTELETDTVLGERVGVSILPAGPNGPASPLLTVNGFLFTAGTPDSRLRAATRFAAFATSGAEQALMLRDANLIPANSIAPTLLEDPAVPKLVAQLGNSVYVPPLPQSQLLFTAGDQLYQSVLEEDQTPAVALQAMETYLEETPLPAVVLRAGENLIVCGGGGLLRVWHSWPGVQEVATGDETDDSLSLWDQAVASFQKACPDTTVDAKFVPMAEVDQALVDARAADELPTLFLVQHDQIPGLAATGVITPVSGLEIEPDAYAPHLLDAFRYEGELYALPQFVDLTSLYYNTELVSDTVTSLDDLLAVASPDQPVLLPSAFRDLYWGVNALGPPVFDAQGHFADTSGLEAWLTWLQKAQAQPGFVISGDARLLESRFTAGRGAYLVGRPGLWPRLREAMGERVRVIPLPAGTAGSSAPLLEVEGFVLHRSVAPELLQQAMAFVRFLSDSATLSLLNRSVYRPPANRRAAEAIDDPALAVFASQAWEGSVVLPHSLTPDQLAALADAFRDVLENDTSPKDAIDAFSSAFAE